MSVPGGPRGHFAVGGGVVVAGNSETYELKVFGGGGELLHVIRSSIPNPAESRLIESARAAQARAAEGGSRPRRRQAPVMETAPAYDWIFVANNGDIRVRRRAGPDQETVRTNIRYSSSNMSSTTGPLWVAEGLDGQEWHVFDRQGRLSARALLPSRFRPTEITASRILGVWKDEVDVESVRVFRLIRGGLSQTSHPSKPRRCPFAPTGSRSPATPSRESTAARRLPLTRPPCNPPTEADPPPPPPAPPENATPAPRTPSATPA